MRELNFISFSPKQWDIYNLNDNIERNITKNKESSKANKLSFASSMLVVIAPNNESSNEYASYKRVVSLQDVAI
jgi:hypothetical protein